MKRTENEDRRKRRAELEMEEYAEIAPFLDDYVVEYPSEMEIDRTIRALDAHMPGQMNVHLEQSPGKSFTELFQLVRGEVMIFHKSYWLVCALLLLCGFWLGTRSTISPYMSGLILVPVPFILGLLEVFKGRDQGLMEIELTCKITAQQLMLTRLIVVLAGNMVFVLLLMLLVSGGKGSFISWSGVGLWYTQLMIAAGASLWLAMRVRGGTAVSIFLVAWFGFFWLMLSNPRFVTLVQSIQTPVLIAVALCGVVLLISQIRQMTRKYTSQTERGYSFEIDHG
ncbi:hypothetical protein [Paenibacillus sp. W2I17]|uniref:hypothetical protein n=1 Tax=Paenibacillus sp. W2I17 TaxID=3042311 RepID=UPI0027813CEB|nr:hypothetical protein [Paenibacillus sp. W2I17]MDQ0656036.1 hypothetical protein [Paenibacillus sp. W2I17]